MASQKHFKPDGYAIWDTEEFKWWKRQRYGGHTHTSAMYGSASAAKSGWHAGQPWDTRKTHFNDQTRYIIRQVFLSAVIDDPPYGLDGKETYVAVDNPFWDGTDGAHPAWWRGEEYGHRVIVDEINKILDGKTPTGTSYQPWQALRERLWSLVKQPKITDGFADQLDSISGSLEETKNALADLHDILNLDKPLKK